jgi:hypothetical protein
MPDEIDEPLGAHCSAIYRSYELAQLIPFEPKTGLGGVESLELRENMRVIERFIERNHEF